MHIFMKTVETEIIVGRSPAAVGTLFHSSLTRQHCDVRDSWCNDGLRVGRPGFESLQGQELFRHSTLLGPTKPLIQWVSGALSSGVKRLGREAGRYLHLVLRPKQMELYLYFPIRLYGVLLN